MSSIFKYFILLILLNNCSLDTKSGIWTEKKNIKIEKDNILKIFSEDEVLEKEFNPKLKIKLTSRLKNNSFVNNLTNNNGRINYNGDLKKISKFKFSKIKNFKYFEPNMIFESDNLIFFNKNGSVVKFDLDSKIIWKKNY